MADPLLTIGSSLFTQTGKDVVAPRINNLIDKLVRECKVNLQSREYHFQEYWLNTYGTFYIVNSVIFGNRQRRLRDIYVPMSLALEGSTDSISINHYPNDLLQTYGKLIIKDSLGMGKSTMLKIMFMEVIDSEKGYPIFVELRNLSDEHSLTDEICRLLSKINESFDKQLLLDLVRQGNFIFFFDGFDEIRPCYRESVVRDIQDFLSKTKNCSFVMTSRKEDSLAGFGSFQGANILPLQIGDVCSLLLRYGENSERVEELVHMINGNHYDGIDDFLKCPLLAGLLYKAYCESSCRELNLVHLCSNVLPVFYEQHDQSKDGNYTHDKRCKLPLFDLDRIVRSIAFYWTARKYEVLSHDSFCQSILFGCKQYGNPGCTVDDLKEDFLKNVPIFSKDGTDYRWTHPSLCDYFTAKFIELDGKEKMDELLTGFFMSNEVKRYWQMLRMFAQMDSENFTLFVTLPMLDKYLAAKAKNPNQSLLELYPEQADRDRMQFLAVLYPEIFMMDSSSVMDIHVAEARALMGSVSRIQKGENMESLIRGL